MLKKLRALADEYRSLEQSMQDLEVLADPKRIATAGKRMAELEPLLSLLKEYDRCQAALRSLEEVAGDPELKPLAEEEAREAQERLPQIEEAMRAFLTPKDPNDDRNVILEVRAGTGGEEAALFAAELLRMYLRYAQNQGWKTEILSKADAEGGGIKEAICRMEGVRAYGNLKYESGVHRVQRVPETESKGRIHTSAASVAILPEAEEVDLVIKPEDLRIDVFRSSGPGGQSVNTTDSAVRVTHLPTGLVVQCQDEKSQLKNKVRALNILRSRLFALEEERRAKERGELRSGQIGSGDRSEKIRTYNFPQDRVTDHRLGKNYSNLPGILEGDLPEIIADLVQRDQDEKIGSMKGST